MDRLPSRAPLWSVILITDLADGAAAVAVVSPLLVDVPTVGTVGERLMRVEADVRAHRAAASGPAPIAILGGLFRPIASLAATGIT